MVGVVPYRTVPYHYRYRYRYRIIAFLDSSTAFPTELRRRKIRGIIKQMGGENSGSELEEGELPDNANEGAVSGGEVVADGFCVPYFVLGCNSRSHPRAVYMNLRSTDSGELLIG